MRLTHRVVLALALYGLGAYALGYFTAARMPVETSTAVAEAKVEIERLTGELEDAEEALEELRTADAAADTAHREAVAEAEDVAEEGELEIAASSARADSIGREIRERVDSAVAVMVAELEAEHAGQMARLRETVEAERRARFRAELRIQTLEGVVAGLERTVATQAEIIAEHEELDAARVGQIRSLQLQRNGTILLAIVGVGCALFCGG